jgi:hypothetical protein
MMILVDDDDELFITLVKRWQVMIPRLSRTSAVMSCLNMFERREKEVMSCGGKPNLGVV